MPATNDITTIDGSLGEGGGQIIRSSLAAAAIKGQPVRITNVRAGRRKPGLMRQHLAAVRAISAVCTAEVEGDEIGSQEIEFRPQAIGGGDYRFSIGSAGSTTLVAQTVLPALLMADGPSKVTIEGGTHNPLAPPFDFFQRAFLPQVNRMGPLVEARLDRYGFMPAGGGKIVLDIQPADRLRGLRIVSRGEEVARRVTAIVAQLEPGVAHREIDTLRRKANWPGASFETTVVDSDDCSGPGNAVVIELKYDRVSEVLYELGRLGTRAERVARNVLRNARNYIASGFPVGTFLADQLLLPMGLAAVQGQTSRFVTGPLSQHSQTHIQLLKTLLDVRIEVEGNQSDSINREGTTVVVAPADKYACLSMPDA